MNEYLELGAIAVVFLFSVKEFFTWLKSKKNGGNPFNQMLLDSVNKINENHLNTIQKTVGKICEDINTGNDRVVDAIHCMHTDVATRLGKIEGKLEK